MQLAAAIFVLIIVLLSADVYLGNKYQWYRKLRGRYWVNYDGFWIKTTQTIHNNRKQRGHDCEEWT